MTSHRQYPGKLLLFGEYAVIHGSQALAIPLHKFSAEWKIDIDHPSLANLKALRNYVKGLAIDKKWSVNFEQWDEDLKKGIYLNSTIKQGYGVGSSGSLVAAIYDRYFIKGGTDISQVRTFLAGIESFFHGASSGIDPLVSYFDQGILKNSMGNVELVDCDLSRLNLSIGLLDTNIPRETSPLVEKYLHKYEKDTTFPSIVDKIKHLNSACISNLQNESEQELFINLNEISTLQFESFKEMIPDFISEFWQSLLSSELHAIKLCGAGGGGYFLLFSKQASALTELSTFPIHWL